MTGRSWGVDTLVLGLVSSAATCWMRRLCGRLFTTSRWLQAYCIQNNNLQCFPLTFKFPLMPSNFLTSCCVLFVQPHVIVHCAAERRPDVVEHHTEAALNLNVHACATLAKEAG